MGKDRASRGKGTASSSTANLTSADPAYYKIDFKGDNDALAKYTSIRRWGLKAKRFADLEALTLLGLRSEVEQLFRNIGWGGLLHINIDTVVPIVLEVMSTLKVKCGPIHGPKRITFQHRNRDMYITLTDLNKAFQSPDHGLHQKPPSSAFHTKTFWRQLVLPDVPDFQSGYSNAIQICNPVIRYVQRFHYWVQLIIFALILVKWYHVLGSFFLGLWLLCDMVDAGTIILRRRRKRCTKNYAEKMRIIFRMRRVKK